jgi:hypothetical protein
MLTGLPVQELLCDVQPQLQLSIAIYIQPA